MTSKDSCAASVTSKTAPSSLSVSASVAERGSVKGNVPFHIWKSEVESAAIARGADIGEMRGEKNAARLNDYYNHLMPTWMAAETMAILCRKPGYELALGAALARLGSRS